MSLPTRWTCVRPGLWKMQPVLTPRCRYEGSVRRRVEVPSWTTLWDWVLTVDDGKTTLARGTEAKLNTAMRAALTTLEQHERSRIAPVEDGHTRA